MAIRLSNDQVNPIVFSDMFEGSSLKSYWDTSQIQGGTVTVTGGYLQMTLPTGGVDHTSIYYPFIQPVETPATFHMSEKVSCDNEVFGMVVLITSDTINPYLHSRTGGYFAVGTGQLSGSRYMTCRLGATFGYADNSAQTGGSAIIQVGITVDQQTAQYWSQGHTAGDYNNYPITSLSSNYGVNRYGCAKCTGMIVQVVRRSGTGAGTFRFRYLTVGDRGTLYPGWSI